MNKLALGLLICCVAAGCTKTTTLSSGGSESASAPQSSDVDLRGTWKGEVASAKDTKSSSDAAGEAFANAFMSMMNFKIRFSEGNAFKMTMVGIPLAGHYTLSGKHITMTVETVMGKTPEEFKKYQESQGNKTSNMDVSKPMEGDLSADGKTITIVDKDKKGPGNLVFKKTEEVPDDKLAETVKGEEKPYVGTWLGKLETKPATDEKEKANQEMAAALMQSVELDLKKDNSFVLNLIIEIHGAWTLEGGKIKLTPKMGESMSKSDTDKPMELDVSEDQKTLVMEDKDKGKLTFTKQ